MRYLDFQTTVTRYYLNQNRGSFFLIDVEWRALQHIKNSAAKNRFKESYFRKITFFELWSTVAPPPYVENG